VLKDANIHTVYDLVTAPKRELLSLDNITSSTLFKFNGRLKSRNLHLEMNLEYDEAKGVYVEVVKDT
jgi:DNA-directed RNA polymerase alpha subunit